MKRRYRLKDLLAQNNPAAPVLGEVQAWEGMPPVGKEILDRQPVKSRKQLKALVKQLRESCERASRAVDEAVAYVEASMDAMSHEDPVLRTYKKPQQDRSRMMIQLGLWKQEDVFLFSREDAQATIIHYRDVDFDEPANVDERKRLARAQQRALDLARLENHLPVIGLLLGKRTQQVTLSRARRAVRCWQRRHLCSRDYINEWRELLAGPMPALVAMLCEDSARGVRLRQNSPFWNVLKRY